MKVSIETDTPLAPCPEDMVGNVYQVRGGTGARHGHVHVIISAYDKKIGCYHHQGYVTITVDRDGDIVGGNSYAQHYFNDKVPIARCDGLESVQLVVRSL